MAGLEHFLRNNLENRRECLNRITYVLELSKLSRHQGEDFESSKHLARDEICGIYRITHPEYEFLWKYLNQHSNMSPTQAEINLRTTDWVHQHKEFDILGVSKLK